MTDLDPRHSLPPLSAVLESMAASLGAADVDNHLRMAPAHSATLLLIDGLGAELVAAHPHDAPHLNAAARADSTTVAAGFPATTAVSLTSLATGRPSGIHGILGYTFRAGAGGLIPEAPIINSLRWCVHGNHDHSLIRTVVPEDFQTTTTIFEKCRAQGLITRQIVPGLHVDSGLSRAALRGADKMITAEQLDDLRSSILAEMSTAAPTLGYAYYGGLDFAGHVAGPGSEPWRQQLRLVDAMVGELEQQLPAGSALVITGDHGMVDTSGARFDIDLYDHLTHGTTAVAGEARVRHIYTKPGAAEDVHAAWQAELGRRATVLSRDDAVDAGWFGSSVRGNIRVRIGDVVAAARGRTAMIRSVAEPLESTMVGNHGSWDSAEQLVPAIVLRGRR